MIYDYTPNWPIEMAPPTLHPIETGNLLLEPAPMFVL